MARQQHGLAARINGEPALAALVQPWRPDAAWERRETMAWYALRPRDPADPRWPLPDSPAITLKAEDAEAARAKFAQAYPSRPFGTPASPVADAGDAGFAHDPEALLVEETTEPASPAKG